MALFWIALALAACVWCVDGFASRKVPGPVLAALSPIRHLFFAWRGDLHLDVLSLHQTYGKLLRISHRLMEAVEWRLTMGRLGRAVRTHEDLVQYGDSLQM